MFHQTQQNFERLQKKKRFEKQLRTGRGRWPQTYYSQNHETQHHENRWHSNLAPIRLQNQRKSHHRKQLI